MLKGILKPRWQHPDAGVRRQAVEQLAAADGAILEQVLREDTEPAVRRVALRHCTHLELLAELAAGDPDTGVRELAGKRHGQLVAGTAGDAPPLALRLELVTRCEQQALLEQLAREGAEAELRERALEKVDRVAVLRDVALNDADVALRLRALDRIDDEPTLERIHRLSRKQDKRVSHRAREKLDALIAEREQPHRAGEQCLQICAATESLGGGHWERDRALLDDLDQQWTRIEAAHRAPHEQRYGAARRAFLDALEQHRRAESPVVSAKETLIADLEALLSPAPGVAADRPAGLQSRLRQARAAWDKLPTLVEDREEALQARFERARDALQARVVDLRREAELRALCKASEKLLARPDVIGEREVKALERRRDATRPDPDPADAPAVGPAGTSQADRRLDEALAALRERLREQVTRKQDALDDLPRRLAELKAALGAGDTGRTLALHDEIQANLDALVAMGVSKKRLGALPSRFEALAREAGVMKSWDRFGARQAREHLCEAMEALVGASGRPEETARRISEARAEWAALNARDPNVNQALWRRFDGAARKAHEPCAAHFERRAAQRRANLEQRRTLAGRLEAYLAAADWQAMDWKGALSVRREALDEWRRASPVDRKAGKALEQRWHASVQKLEDRLDDERERCVRARERLIEQVSALAEGPDPRRAGEECKSLQRQWAATVPAARERENDLWQRFRAACDAVFEQRRKTDDAEREQTRENLALRQALCERLEALTDAGASEIDEALQSLNRMQGEWEQLGTLPARAGAAVEKRFAAAVRKFRDHRQALLGAAIRADLATLERKAALCHEAETVTRAATPDAGALDALRGQWQALPAIADPEQEQTIATRFERACQGFEDGAAESAAGQAREDLCLRMEILAEVDSPPEFTQARMAYQVQRLSSTLSGGEAAEPDSLDSLVRRWCLAGPAPRGDADALEQRYRRARAAL